MAKDPAFLFYSSDFYTGTAFMTDEQVGKYIRLLCLQHQHGHLTEQHMINICKTYDEHIFAKFEKLPDGKYHNLRLHNEILKRNAYSESRRNNRLAKKDMSNICKSYDVAVSTHMENENRNKNINTDTKKGNAKGKQKKVHPLFSKIIKRFCEGYEREIGIKYRDVRKDVKELKDFLLHNPDMTEDLFFQAVNICLKDLFHRNNLSIRYVCAHFTTILAKGKNNDK
jgi:hypothetical protein